MVSKATIVFGLVAMVTAAGCATGTRAVGLDPATSDATAQAGIGGDRQPRCSGGSYNRAAGMCVTAGP